MASSQHTIILFIRRRLNSELDTIESNIHTYFRTYQDVTVNTIERAFSTYVNTVYSDTSYHDYVTMIKGIFTEDDDLIKRYREAFTSSAEFKYDIASREYRSLSPEEQKIKSDSILVEFIRKIEKKKILYFLLAYNSHLVLAKSGEDKKIVEKFAGYKFTNRRGQEGIDIILDDDDKIVNLLYNEKDNNDPAKLNYYIKKSFNDENIALIHEDISPYAKQIEAVKLFDYFNIPFVNEINTKTARSFVTDHVLV